MVARLTALIASAQIVLAAALVWLLTGTEVPDPARLPSPPRATQRLAELLARTASRAVVTGDSAALNELIRRSIAWPEVAYVSVEDAQGRILAHTDASKVGATWSARLAQEVRATVLIPYEEVAAPLTDVASAGRGAGTGRLRLGYITDLHFPAAGSQAAPRAILLAVVVVLAAISAVPVAIIAARAGRTDLASEGSAGPHERPGTLLDQLDEAHGEALRAQNDLGHRTNEVVKLRNERDRQIAELEELRASLRHQVEEANKLRADGARLEAALEGQERSVSAGWSATEQDTRREGKRLQTRAVGQIAQAFRSSLTNVVGYSKLLLRGMEGELNPGQKANVATVLDAGSRLVAIVNGLSEYVRVDAGAEVAPERVDMGSLVSEIAAEASRDGRVKVSAAPSTDPLAARVDRGHLELILRALVVDAMSLDPRATGTLSVVSAEGSVACELALAEFHTPLDDLENLLDPFASDDLSHPLDEGRLRLAVARALAAANGGRLHLEHRGPAEVAFVLALPGAAT